MNKLIGKCLCETIHYAIEGELGPVFNCHCSKCRRWHGAAFRTRASVNRDQFSWTKGEANLSQFQSSDNATKYFCKTCGSPLITTYKTNPEVLGIALGPLEISQGELNANIEAHIFVDSKAPWHHITDSLPQYSQWPENESKVRQTATTRNKP